MKLVPATGDILEEILDTSHELWSDGLTRAAYGRYNDAQMRTPWGARHLRRLALLDDDGHLLSSAKRYDLEVRLDGETHRAVGVAAVFTPPSVRGRGSAREIVMRMTADAARDGAALALLFSEIGPSYYEAMGFVPVPRREFVLRVRAGRGAPMIPARATEDRDVPVLAELAATMAAGHRFAQAPTPDAIRYSLSKKRLLAGFLPAGALSVDSFVVEEGGIPAAFVILTTTRDDVILEMCGDRDPTGARVGALLQYLEARTPSARPVELTCSLPPGWLPPQVEIHARGVARDVMMVRPLVDGVLERPLRDEDVLWWHGDQF